MRFRTKDSAIREFAPLRTNHITRITSDFKMDLIYVVNCSYCNFIKMFCPATYMFLITTNVVKVCTVSVQMWPIYSLSNAIFENAPLL